MSNVTEQLVLDLLRTIPLPDLEGVSAAEAFVAFRTGAGQATLELALGYPLNAVDKSGFERLVADRLAGVGVEGLRLEVQWRVPQAQSANNQTAIPGVKNIIAVASGKGGVGKSTVSANLALALAAEGARVGVLDADIYGPSQSHMLGVADQRPEVDGNTIQPLRAYGLQCISMGNLVTENTPMVWRGPMVSGALQQLLNNTRWTDLDYLIIDMPPGTGDIQITLSQRVPVSAAVIVTTPQDIALLDAKKGIEMFGKVNIPVLGIIENMATHTCANCGHTEAIFGEHGGARLAEEYGVNLLGQLPLRADIRAQTDQGKPPVAADPNSDISLLYRQIARRAAAALWQQTLAGDMGPEISVEED